MDVFFAEGMCFDTTMEGNGGPSGGVPHCAKVRVLSSHAAYPRIYAASRMWISENSVPAKFGEKPLLGSSVNKGTLTVVVPWHILPLERRRNRGDTAE